MEFHLRQLCFVRYVHTHSTYHPAYLPQIGNMLQDEMTRPPIDRDTAYGASANVTELLNSGGETTNVESLFYYID